MTSWTGRRMPGVRVTYDPELPAEIGESIIRKVQGNLDILPAWILQLFVCYDTEQESGAVCAIEPNIAYCRALLRIGPKWLDNNDKERTLIVVHEFLHAHDWPLILLLNETLDILEKSYDAPVLACRLRDDLVRAREQATSNLTELVLRLIARGDIAASDDAGALGPG